MDAIADADDSPRQRRQVAGDREMVNHFGNDDSSSFSDSSQNESSSNYESPEQQKINKQRRKIQKFKGNIETFFKDNLISDLMPYNQKLVVLNNELTMCQTIEAMIHHQNMRSAVVWNNQKRKYQQIITLRDILECILYVGDKLQEVINLLESSSNTKLDSQTKATQFVRDHASIIIDTFMEKYIYNTIELEIDSDDFRNDEESKHN